MHYIDARLLTKTIAFNNLRTNTLATRWYHTDARSPTYTIALITQTTSLLIVPQRFFQTSCTNETQACP